MSYYIKIKHKLTLNREDKLRLQMIFYFFYFLFKRIRSKPAKKSVYFIGNCYNAFYTLACGLEKLGWRACSLNPDGDCKYVQNYHKAVRLHDDIEAIKIFFDILFNYKVLHVYNRTTQSLYTGSSAVLKSYLKVEYLKAVGKVIIYSPSGCLDGATSKEINAMTNGLCHKCIWHNNMEVCNDITNQEKIDWILKNCNLFSNEVDWPKKLAATNIGCTVPLSPLDHRIYDPKIEVPSRYLFSKKPGELIVLTAFGNEKLRTNETKDIKGKKYMLAAINQLIQEGLPIQHFHATEIPTRDMKYIQVQADIIIDQLNYGTIGSAAREGMMLGKPVICRISDEIRAANIAMRDCPAIDASEGTIYNVLKALILAAPEERAAIGKKSREWMLEWFDVDVCARRYDKIYDYLHKGLPLPPLGDKFYATNGNI